MSEDLWFGIEVTATGLLVVFMALISVALIVALFQRLQGTEEPSAALQLSESGWGAFLRHYIFIPAPGGKEQEPAATPASKPATGTAPKESTGSEGIPPETLVAIMAAASIATGKKIRIHRVQYRSGPADTAWSRQGRVDIMTSHQPKR
jgi:hypothetical protein